ncbi:MAG: hypothetical protein ACPGNT_08895 [Rhodospirillales bacterium]
MIITQSAPDRFAETVFDPEAETLRPGWQRRSFGSFVVIENAEQGVAFVQDPVTGDALMIGDAA